MSFWLYGLCLLLTIASMPGCLPIPLPTKLPFGEEALEFIEPGITGRGEIETIFGKPDVERADSSLSIYYQYRTMAVLISQSGLGEMGTGHMLLVHYDANDLVKTSEVLRLGVVGGSLDGYKQACASNGICVA